MGGDILPVLAMCKFWFSLAQGMHDIKDVRKYDVMSDKDGGKYVLWLRKLCASTGLLRKFRPYKCHREENYHIFEKEKWSVCLKVIPTKSCIIHCQSKHGNMIFLSTDG